jgi:hypothetical protein
MRKIQDTQILNNKFHQDILRLYSLDPIGRSALIKRKGRNGFSRVPYHRTTTSFFSNN